MVGVLSATTCVLYSVAGVLLVWKYRKTGDIGFLWLGWPLVLLPFASIPLALWVQEGVDRLALGGRGGTFPFTLVEQGRVTLGTFLTLLNLLEHVVWGGLSVIALCVLRPRAARGSANHER